MTKVTPTAFPRAGFNWQLSAHSPEIQSHTVDAITHQRRIGDCFTATGE